MSPGSATDSGSARVNLVVPAHVRAGLEALAAEDSTTVSEACRRLLEVGMERRRRERIYREVARAYPAQKALYLALIEAYAGLDDQVSR